MNDFVGIASLTLGGILVLTHVVVALVAAIKAPPAGTGGSLTPLDAPTQRVFDVLDKLVDKAPLVAAGILLVLIAAVATGTLSASVVFGS